MEVYRAEFAVLLIALSAASSIIHVVAGMQVCESVGDVIVVPDDYPSIQDAVRNAGAGSKIVVKQGVYVENVVIENKKDIVIEGEKGTVIRGYLSISSSSNLVLKNLVFINESPPINIYKSSTITFEAINITHIVHDTLIGPVVYIMYSFNVSVRNTIIEANTPGIYIYKSFNVSIEYSVINVSTPGISITDATPVLLAFNTIYTSRTAIKAGCYGYYPNMTLELKNNKIIGKSGKGYLLYLWGLSPIRLNLSAVGNEIYFPEGVFFRNLLPDGSNITGYAYLNSITVKNTDPVGTWVKWYSPSPVRYVYNGRSYIGHLGNYWSLYNGSDSNHDGIGDEPFNFSGIYDPYPLYPYSSIIERIDFSGIDTVAVYLWNGTRLMVDCGVGNISFTASSEYVVVDGGGKHRLTVPINITVFMVNTGKGFRLASTTDIASVNMVGGSTRLWLNITLEEPGMLAVRIPDNYTVLGVFKDGIPAEYSFDLDTRTLFLGDPLNVSILLRMEGSGEEAGGRGLQPMPEPYMLPILVMAALLTGILAKKRG